MATTLLVRGSNPVWSFVDLTGHQFDDTFYMWVLQNDIPYFPATVWEDISGNVPWTQPIQFLANGTLPIDIFWDPNVVYRLEFRQHIDPLTSPTQADPLIYLVENYSPGGSGSTPSASGIITENQIANPQFSEITFDSPYTITAATDITLEVAPGWILELTGTGNLSLERIALTSTLTNPTNAPYALRITLSGWHSPGVKLIQRFAENGMLWASTPGHTRYVSSSVTARVEGDPAFISAQLVDSMSTVLQTILPSTQLNGSFNEYKGFGVMPVTTNTNTPPAAWIEYQMLLPSTVDIYLTSFQVIQSEIAGNFEYEQNSIDRQIDHLFHYWKPKLAFKPLPSYLTGWDFPLNPAQFYGRTVTPKAVGANKAFYAWDQTLVFQTVDNSVAVGNSTFGGGSLALALQPTTDMQAAIMQYLPAPIAVNMLLNRLCSMVTCGANVPVTATITLWYTTNVSLPTLPAVFFTGLDANGLPTGVIGGWSKVPRGPANIYGDAKFTIPAVPNTTNEGYGQIGISGWNLDNFATASTATYFAIVIGTATIVSGFNTVGFKSVSLQSGDISTIPAPQTPDEVLRECQYYFQKSFLPATAPAQNAGFGTGEEYSIQNAPAGSVSGIGPIVRFSTPMNHTPFVTLYNPIAANGEIATQTFGSWSSSLPSAGNQTLVTVNGFPTRGTTPLLSGIGNLIMVHWTASALLGTF